jgi:epsin
LRLLAQLTAGTVTKGYSAVEVKVRNATSNDPWGPVGSDMAEIAQITFNK